MPRSLFKVRLCPARGYLRQWWGCRAAAPITWVRHKSSPSTASFPALMWTEKRENNQVGYGRNLGCGNWGIKPPLCHRRLWWPGINHSAILCIGSKLTPSAQYLLCVQTSGESWCLDECCALIKASAGSPDNSTSTLKGVCKCVRSAKADLMGGAGKQSWMATQKAMLSGEKQSQSLSTSGVRRCPLWQGDSSHCPQTRTGAFYGAGLCRKTMSFEQTAKRERATLRWIWEWYRIEI